MLNIFQVLKKISIHKYIKNTKKNLYSFVFWCLVKQEIEWAEEVYHQYDASSNDTLTSDHDFIENTEIYDL